VSAAPELKSLIYDRMIAEDVLDAFHMTAQGERWIYETRLMDGGTCKRGKAFNSASTPKYTWVPEKAQGALYFYPPGRSLSEAIKADNGVLYMAGGDIGTMSLMSAGLWNVTNTFGDSSIPATLAADMQKLGVKRLVLLPDRDTSGQRWACKIRDLMIPVGLDIDLEAKVLPFPLQDSHGMDVNDWWINLCDTTPSDEDEKALLREQITTLKEWRLPEPERKSTDVPDAVLGPLELPQDFITAITNALDTEPRYNGTGWTRKPVRCPFHDDAHPSAFWNAHMAILRCHSACGKSYLAKEVGEKLGIHMRDYLSATPRIPTAKTTAGGTTISAVPKLEAPAPVVKVDPPAKLAPMMRPALPAYAAMSEDDLRLASTGRGWLGEYVTWASKAAPASPEIFHEAMGLWLLASISTRRIALPWGGRNVYGNLYILIVAKTSLYRKSTAMRQVLRVLEAAKLDALRLPEDATPEALFDELCGVKPSNFDALSDEQRADWMKGRTVAAQRTFIKDEASSIFANLRKEYYGGLAELLLQGYDPDGGRIQKLLKGRGLVTLKRMCLSFLGATTPVMLAKYMTNEERENGFFARMAIITPEEPPVYRSSFDPVNVPAVLSDRLYAVFAQVLPWNRSGKQSAGSLSPEPLEQPVMQATIEPIAAQRLDKYSQAVGFDMVQDEIAGDKDASYSRLPEMAIKAALLLAMSDTQPGQITHVTLAHALAGMMIAERWRESLHRLDRDTARATGNRTEDKVLEYLRMAGASGSTLREIKRDCAIREQRFATEALTSLSDAGLVERFNRPAGPKGGRPALVYRIAGSGDTHDPQ
jgi:hypothetical protein